MYIKDDTKILNVVRERADKLMTSKEVCYVLGVSTRSLIRWREVHAGPSYIQSGNYIRYRADQVLLWLQANMVDVQ